MDIQKLNCLTPDNAATPKYNPYSGKSCVQVYYANNNKVIIVGVADNNYLLYSAAFLKFLRAKHITPTNS